MSEGKKNKDKKTVRNAGFSLLELIVGIIFLIIIMLPLLNNFLHSARLNKEAKETQQKSLISSSIMESIKGMTIDDIKKQCMGGLADFDLTKSTFGRQLVEEVKVIVNDELSGRYKFALNGVKENDSIFDAIITIQADDFRLPEEEILNSYPMPEAINLDIYANGIMFSDGRGVYPDSALEIENTDKKALEFFLNEGVSLARRIFEQSYEYQAAKAKWENECEQARLEGKPMPARPSAMDFNPDLFPDFCNPELIKLKISKSMNVTVNNQSDKHTISYFINYQCRWAYFEGVNSSCQYNIMDIKFPKAIKNIYLFYLPTQFMKETINIKNETSEHEINFFLAKQGEANSLPELIVNIDRNDNIRIFTNINSPCLKLNDNGLDCTDKIIGDIVDSRQRDRIYHVEIKIYKYEENMDDKYKEELYSLTSSIGKE